MAPEHIRHADIPCRPVFAAIPNDEHSHDERYRQLDFFHRNLRNMMTK